MFATSFRVITATGVVLLWVAIGVNLAWGQRTMSPSDAPVTSPRVVVGPPATEQRAAPATTPQETVVAESQDRTTARQTLVASLTIFVLAVFVGFEVIAKVPPTLHTPLMSGSNAISGITLVGAVIVAANGFRFSSFLGFVAVILATINVAGGFLVTHRMLAMFKRK